MRIILPALVAGLSVFLILVFIWYRWGLGRKRETERYPDPEDIIFPPGREPLLLAAPPEPEPPPPPPPPQGTVFIADMEVGDTVHCATANSHYRFRLIDKALGWFEVHGGRIDKRRKPVTAHFVSSHRTGVCHHEAFSPGMSLQFFIQAAGQYDMTRVVTTRVTRVFLARTTAGT